MYNQDYSAYTDFKTARWQYVQRYDLSDECPLLDVDILEFYFTTPRFFENLNFMDSAKEVLNDLKNDYMIYVVSLGQRANLRLKYKWICENLPFARFIGIDTLFYKNKNHIDMRNGTLIDDHIWNLSSNAKNNICFGEITEWNKDWKGARCANWYDIKRLLDKEAKNG